MRATGLSRDAAIAAIAPPNASEPTSPMNTRAGYRLNHRNPRQPPAIPNARRVTSGAGPVTMFGRAPPSAANPSAPMTDKPEASPSSPSARFIAFDVATTASAQNAIRQACHSNVAGRALGRPNARASTSAAATMNSSAIFWRAFSPSDRPLLIFSRSSAKPIPANSAVAPTIAANRTGEAWRSGGRREYARTAATREALTMSMPPMVGVPSFFRCLCGPSSLTRWPAPARFSQPIMGRPNASTSSREATGASPRATATLVCGTRKLSTRRLSEQHPHDLLHPHCPRALHQHHISGLDPLIHLPRRGRVVRRLGYIAQA